MALGSLIACICFLFKLVVSALNARIDSERKDKEWFRERWNGARKITERATLAAEKATSVVAAEKGSDS
jgi:hypothetical protein